VLKYNEKAPADSGALDVQRQIPVNASIAEKNIDPAAIARTDPSATRIAIANITMQAVAKKLIAISKSIPTSFN
jgi:hypothetical protein